MTIETIRKMTDWKRTLNCRSVYVEVDNPDDFEQYRVVSVGRKYVKCMGLSCDFNLDPSLIVRFRGLE